MQRLKEPSLTARERKKLVKELEALERKVAYEAAAATASVEGRQFACSQSAVNEDDPIWQVRPHRVLNFWCCIWAVVAGRDLAGLG
jgi:hypothetical protein